MKTKAALAIGILTVVFAVPAFCATYNYTFCFKYDKEFEDASIGDRYTNNGNNVKAYGIYAIFFRQSDDSVVWSGYTGQSNGCVEIELDNSYLYAIKLVSGARLNNNNYIYVKHSPTNQTYYSRWVTTNFQPAPQPYSYTYIYGYNSSTKTSNMLAAMGKSIYSKPGGTSNQEYFGYTAPCGVNGNCFDWNADPAGISVGSEGRGDKFTIAHEIGHNIEYVREGEDAWFFNCQNCGAYESDEDCKSECQTQDHTYTSKEFMTCAAHEGLADWYAAAVWNDKEAGCVAYDGHNCWTLNIRSLENYCSDASIDGKGVEGDWARFLWHIYVGDGVGWCHNEALTVADVFSIYQNTDPPPYWWGFEEGYNELKDAAVPEFMTANQWNTCADSAGINHPPN